MMYKLQVVNVLVLLPLFVYASMNVSEVLDPNYTFEQYLIDFNKTYDNHTEYQYRQQIFYQNYQAIQELDSQANGEYHVNVNNFTDWTDAEKKKLTGLKNPLREGLLGDSLPLRLTGSSQSLPSTLNYIQLGKVTPPKQQKSCGACWAFSATGQLQSLLLIYQNKSYDLSQQYSIQCSSSGSCQGGYPYAALDLIIPQGAPTQQQYPYTVSDYGYIYNQICYAKNRIKLQGNISSIRHFSYLTDDQIKQILYYFGPVSVAVHGDPFYSYHSGVFNGCPKDADKKLDHAVLLVGYTQEGHWILKNSWGPKWGQNGFIIVNKNRNCGLNAWVDVVIMQQKVNEIMNANTSTNNSDKVVYGVNMTDSYGDGWNGLILGVKQNGHQKAIFGQQFTDGTESSPTYFSLQKGFQAVIYVVKFAKWSYQIGFQIYENETKKVVLSHSGQKLSSDSILGSWCPGNNCHIQEMVNLTIVMQDRYGDGWNGNVLALQQQNKIVGQFGNNFTDGYENSPIEIVIPSGIVTKIVVNKIGNYRSQIYFSISNGNDIIFQWQYKQFTKQTILGTICPNCLTQTYHKLKQNQIQQNKQNLSQKSIKTQNQTDNNQLQNTTIKEILLYIFAILAFIFLITIIVMFIFLRKYSRQMRKNIDKNKQKQDQSTKNNLQVEFTNKRIGNQYPKNASNQ